jgi:hypothetical protein
MFENECHAPQHNQRKQRAVAEKRRHRHPVQQTGGRQRLMVLHFRQVQRRIRVEGGDTGAEASPDGANIGWRRVFGQWNAKLLQNRPGMVQRRVELVLGRVGQDGDFMRQKGVRQRPGMMEHGLRERLGNLWVGAEKGCLGCFEVQMQGEFVVVFPGIRGQEFQPNLQILQRRRKGGRGFGGASGVQVEVRQFFTFFCGGLLTAPVEVVDDVKEAGREAGQRSVRGEGVGCRQQAPAGAPVACAPFRFRRQFVSRLLYAVMNEGKTVRPTPGGGFAQHEVGGNRRFQGSLCGGYIGFRRQRGLCHIKGAAKTGGGMQYLLDGSRAAVEFFDEKGDRDARQAPPFRAGKDSADGGAVLWVYLSAVSVAARCTGARWYFAKKTT